MFKLLRKLRDHGEEVKISLHLIPVMDKRAPLKVVVVGDGMVGKSCMCKSFANKEPYRNKAYQPTMYV